MGGGTRNKAEASASSKVIRGDRNVINLAFNLRPPPVLSEIWKREITNLCCFEVHVCVLSPGCEAQGPQLRP